MNFCPDCETYLVTKFSNTENPNKIIKVECNNCSYSKVIDTSKEPEYKCVYKKNYDLKNINIEQKNIQFMKNDATLPHVNNIQCPNPQCISNKENPNSEILGHNMNLDPTITNNINNVMYIKLNESNLTYLYQCCNCNHTWSNK